MPQDYKLMRSIGVHDARELAAQFKSEPSEEAHGRFDQLATQLMDVGMDEQEIELATCIEWYMRDLSQAWVTLVGTTGAMARLFEWAKDQLLTQDCPPGSGFPATEAQP